MQRNQRLIVEGNANQSFAKFALVFIFSVLAVAIVLSVGFVRQYPKALQTSLAIVQSQFALVFGGKSIPSGLSSSQYYLLGIAYKNKGWVETSRQAMRSATEAEPTSLYAHSAAVFLKVALPREPISTEAEEGNIDAYNLMAGDGAKAAEAFRSMIERYPRFEWPMGNLAAMYLDENNLAEAEKLINSALEINPTYVNGLRYKAQLKLKQGDPEGAKQAWQQALDAFGPPDQLDSTLSGLREEILQQQERIKL